MADLEISPRELESSVAAQVETRARLEALLRHLPQKIFFKDAESRYVAVNEAFAADHGLAPDQIVGKTDFDLYPSELAERYRADDRDVIESRRPRTVVVRYQNGAESSHAEVTKVPLFDQASRPTGVMGFFTPTSAKRHAEEALRRERHLLGVLMDNVPDSIYFKDRSGRFTRVNRAAAARLGLEDVSQALGKRDSDFFSSEHATEAIADEDQVIQSGRPIIDKEERETWLDGHVSWVATSKMPLRDPDGNVIGTFGVSRDVTQRHEAEAALRRQTRILQSVLDSISDGVVVTDAQGHFLLFNPAAEQILHLGPRDVDPREWADAYGLFRPDGTTPYPAEQLPLALALRGESVDGSEIFVRHERIPEGAWISVDARPLRDDQGTLVGAVAAFRDVSARKRTEEALRSSEERYRELFENANDVVYTHDLTGRMTSLNKAGELSTGYSAAEANGMRIEDIVAPEHLERAREMTRRKLAGLASTTYELEVVAKDGRRVPLEVSTRIIFQSGQAIGVQGIGRDVTERRRAQEALQRQARQLGEQAEELERRNAALSKAYGELKEAESQLIQSEKMAAIGQLVAGLAHEINNPAAYVLTNLTVIARDLDDLLAYIEACHALEEAAAPHAPERVEALRALREQKQINDATTEIRALVDAAKGGMVRIRDLVASLRSYSRIEMRGEFVMGDLNEGLDATLVLLRPIVPKGLSIDIKSTELPVVECNLGQINQVFMNLLVNAVQAVGESGTISIETGRAADGVAVRIRDSGPGIGAEIRSRIFDPFFTTKEVGQGTGLGLSISRRIIEAHHGSIDVESTGPEGTTFRIWLPLRQPPAASSEPSPSALAAP